jgi:hypothetical protein
MKRTLLIIILILLSINCLAEDNNLYQKDSLKLQLDINGAFTLVPENSAATIKEVTVELLLFPKEDYRQTLFEIDTTGETNGNKVVFYWDDQQLEKKQYYYSAIINTENKKNEVKNKISFPLTNIGLEEYLQPTITIDSDNPKIIQKATELADGEDDLFKVAFNLASWVETNVEYDLNTLTATASQSASWVLENKQGVCDEMTSLFIAMCRSLGIPARFVSGISYTTSELFEENWQPHGWAEVYFPEIGWVSFDITFGEFGYIDVTHIKLRESDDPSKPATKFEWLANKVKLETGQLDFNVKVLEKGNEIEDEIILEQEILSSSVDLGSYNLIKGILKNTADYYVATTLSLAVPDEINIIGKNKRPILLSPKEVRETFWVVNVPEDLNPTYWYTFPTIIYSEKNVSVKDSFKAVAGTNFYSKQEIDKLTVKDEEKTYSRKVSFNCIYQDEIKLNQKMTIKCSVKNIGNSNLNKVNFCLGKVCEIINLPINQKETREIVIEAKKAGWQKLLISAENEDIEKKSSIEYVVLDNPSINITINSPKTINYGQEFSLKFNLSKNSFNLPKNIILTMELPGRENKWEIEQITKDELFELKLEGIGVSKNNVISVTTTWKDQENQSYFDKQELILEVKANNSFDNIKMFFNRIINWFL